MSIRSICRFIYILTFSALVLSCVSPVYAQVDTTAMDTISLRKVKKPDSAGHQLCLGIDMVRLAANSYYNDRYGYEMQGDYYLHNEYYLAVEGGWGGSTVNYADLKYTTTNNFVRVGFNKCILTRDNPKDWDMMFMGIRIGEANITRSKASFIVIDSVWGNSTTQYFASKSYPAIWMELTGGMRVEIIRGFYAGWNVRGKFILNGKSFKDLSPLYIAGYGKGDKAGNFDFNLYISYGIRWKRKSLGIHDAKTGQPVTPKPTTLPNETKEKQDAK